MYKIDSWRFERSMIYAFMHLLLLLLMFGIDDVDWKWWKYEIQKTKRGKFNTELMNGEPIKAVCFVVSIWFEVEPLFPSIVLLWYIFNHSQSVTAHLPSSSSSSYLELLTIKHMILIVLLLPLSIRQQKRMPPSRGHYQLLDRTQHQNTSDTS